MGKKFRLSYLFAISPVKMCKIDIVGMNVSQSGQNVIFNYLNSLCNYTLFIILYNVM